MPPMITIATKAAKTTPLTIVGIPNWVSSRVASVFDWFMHPPPKEAMVAKHANRKAIQRQRLPRPFSM